ncbi:hypothetical protein BDZ94DRAFT_1314565 [Collybia nuda]|uniref:Uncharacterized protein n=1 Tax=Collybia nuda TaxID=64659 RepID=A0A9P5XT04_9AGAR|nr:hypothetical protein BDZ94DRAFT_1314565 [Collybia nuda]
MDTLLSLSKGSFRHLEDLSLHHVYPGFQSSSALGTHGSQRFGSLQRLAISGNCSVTPYILHFPLFQLTELSITGCMVTPTITHYILQQCTSLTVGHFSIRKSVSGAFDYRPSGRVRSPLKSLTLALYLILDWDLFLVPLVLPSLVSFTNADYSDAPTSLSPVFSRAMRSLIIRSNCSLESLCLSPHAVANIDFSYPEVTALLQKIPTLEILVLRGNIMEPDLIRLVHELLPQLRVIDWRVRPDGLHTFLDLLEHYLADTSMLKRFPAAVNIICEHHNDMSSVRARYAKNYKVFKDAGICITVLDTLGNDMRRWGGLGGGESVLAGQ